MSNSPKKIYPNPLKPFGEVCNADFVLSLDAEIAHFGQELAVKGWVCWPGDKLSDFTRADISVNESGEIIFHSPTDNEGKPKDNIPESPLRIFLQRYSEDNEVPDLIKVDLGYGDLKDYDEYRYRYEQDMPTLFGLTLPDRYDDITLDDFNAGKVVYVDESDHDFDAEEFEILNIQAAPRTRDSKGTIDIFDIAALGEAEYESLQPGQKLSIYYGEDGLVKVTKEYSV